MNSKQLLPSLLLSCAAVAASAGGLTPIEQLGKAVFFDQNLSANANQSCATCHSPALGWTGPDATINAEGAVYEGSIAGRFGARKPPSSAYATPSPILHFLTDKKETVFVGGNFWDGRATGARLGSPAAEQAQGPFLNPVEQSLFSAADVVALVCGASYPVTFESVFPGDCVADPKPWEVSRAYDHIAFAVAAYEASPESNAYTSKYDAYLAGQAKLSKLEKLGLNLFKSMGKCSGCHVLEPGPNGERPLLTDFTFDNLGFPRNPDNPYYTQPATINPDGWAWLDVGLGGFLEQVYEYSDHAADNYGKHKVPTVRNVDQRPYPDFVKAYGHNGYFKSLEQVVHYYNTRDAKPRCVDDPATTSVDESLFTTAEHAIAQGCWPEPEVLVNLNTKELGNLHLTAGQEAAIVAFLKTLSDGYTAP